MVNSSLEALEERVTSAAKKIKKLEHERDRLLSELAFLDEENKRARIALHENEKLKEDRLKIRERLSRLYQKVEKIKL